MILIFHIPPLATPIVYTYQIYARIYHLTNVVYNWPNSGRISDVCFSKLTQVWITVDPIPNCSCKSIILVKNFWQTIKST